jgi:hypothetical protein
MTIAATRRTLSAVIDASLSGHLEQEMSAELRRGAFVIKEQSRTSAHAAAVRPSDRPGAPRRPNPAWQPDGTPRRECPDSAIWALWSALAARCVHPRKQRQQAVTLPQRRRLRPVRESSVPTVAQRTSSERRSASRRTSLARLLRCDEVTSLPTVLQGERRSAAARPDGDAVPRPAVLVGHRRGSDRAARASPADLLQSLTPGTTSTTARFGARKVAAHDRHRDRLRPGSAAERAPSTPQRRRSRAGCREQRGRSGRANRPCPVRRRPVSGRDRLRGCWTPGCLGAIVQRERGRRRVTRPWCRC